MCYMPFVRNGGLFIPTNSSYKLGDEVFMLLSIMGEDEKIPVAGRVIWITPKGAQGKRTAGIDGAGRTSMGAEAWDAWLKEWRARIHRAAERLAGGDVRIRKWQTTSEARGLNLLSRFGELRRDG